MFITASFTIAKISNQPKYPSIDEWIRKIVLSPYNGILFSHKKKWSTNACYNVEET